MSVNKLILGDNLEILKRMESESVDLIYLDPPFFSNRNYEVIWGDAVLDPFMGGGTTVAVADKLNRKWIGIDQSVQAVKVTELRLDKQRDLFSAPFTIQLHKYDYDTLRYANAFEFESEWNGK